MNTTPMLDTSTKFFNPNQLQTANPNVYNVMYNAPYQNLPNGQYSQNQYDTRYATPNTLLQQPLVMASMPTAPTTMAYQPQPQLPQQHQQQQRFQEMAEKVQTYDESSESPKKMPSVRFAGSNHSNSGNSSSNSDDSNNDSDSSSNDSDADKESPKKMLVKPIRINLNSNKVSPKDRSKNEI